MINLTLNCRTSRLAIRLVSTLLLTAIFTQAQQNSHTNRVVPPPGSITGVLAGTDLTGGGTSGTVTLNLDTTKVPQLATANTFSAAQTVNGNLTATGAVSGTSFQIGSNLFGWGNAGNWTAFVGFSGNTSTTGLAITGTGYQALLSNTTGNSNTADGMDALQANTSGNSNTAVGVAALQQNRTGGNNVALGTDALFDNVSGSANTAVGLSALYYATSSSNTALGNTALQNVTSGNANTGVGNNAGKTVDSSPITGKNNTALGTGAAFNTGALTNATALGANAEVDASNSLVLGSVNGYNGQTVTVKVGIGTTAPTNVFSVGFGAGHAIADGWDTYSSRRWKTNIETLKDALNAVERLRGVSYDRIDDGKHEIGVIAEEVGAVLPEVVSFEENGKDARGVDYSRLTALLIEAVKQQQTQITALRSQLAAITSQLKTQKPNN